MCLYGKGLLYGGLVLIASVSLLAAQPEAGKPLSLGSIDFPTSGSQPAQREFVAGVLALHSFWYAEARERFRRAQELDPEFGMAFWGEAMSYDNALGTETGLDNEQLGAAVVQRFTELDAQGKLEWTERERGYAEAVKLRFNTAWDTTTRRREYGQAMDRLVEEYPEDDEARVFAALALMSYPAFDNQVATHVVSAAAPLEEVFMRNRNHPGVLHYLIHIYDSQTFAPMALRQARLYASIAPASSHALHMPSHIFRHLGMWEEVADSNEAAYQASVDWQQRTGRPLHMRDYHSLDWLLYAYLQLGQIDDAAKIVTELKEIERQIEQRGEDWGHFQSIAQGMRQTYQRYENP